MPSSSETLLCQYRYDPLDRLVANALPDEPERQRFYCKSRLATELHGAIGYSIVQHEDQLVAQQRSEGDARETALLATDKQRSVLQSQRANQPGQPFVYSPYGHRPIANRLLSLLGFNGERPDPVTGWYLLGNGYRAFIPVLMCFTSPDSVSPFGTGGLNAYTYCLGNPIKFSDPSGHSIASIAAAKILNNALKRSRNTVPRVASGIKKRKISSRAKAGPENFFRIVEEQNFRTLSINNGVTTTYMDSSGFSKTTINSPSLKQLSFSASKGSELQNFASSSRSSAELVSATDKSIGDINLNNFLDNVRHRNPNNHNLDRTQFHAQNEAYASAINGRELGILPNRAINQIIRYGNDAESPNTALKDRFLHLF